MGGPAALLVPAGGVGSAARKCKANTVCPIKSQLIHRKVAIAFCCKMASGGPASFRPVPRLPPKDSGKHAFPAASAP